MTTNPNGDWEDNLDSDLNDQSGIGDTPSLEEQEQLNSANLIQRMEAENESNPDSDENQTIDQPAEGEEDLTGFFEKRTSEPNMDLPAEKDKPLTRNLLGDNPPGAEKIVFESGSPGDASAEHFKYDEDTIEGFRENLDKTEQQISIDKKLKGNKED